MERTRVTLVALLVALLACVVALDATHVLKKASFDEGQQSCSTAISLTEAPFVFVGHAVSKMYICSNGLVLFDEPAKEFDAAKPHDLSQGSIRAVAPYWSSKLSKVRITATLQEKSEEAVELVEKAFPHTKFTPGTTSLNITWVYADKSVEMVMLADEVTHTAYGVFFYSGQYMPVSLSSALGWLLSAGGQETPVIGFSAGGKASGSYVPKIKEWSNVDVLGRVVFAFTGPEAVHQAIDETVKSEAAVVAKTATKKSVNRKTESKKALAKRQANFDPVILSVTATPDGGEWTKTSTFSVTYVFTNNMATTSEYGWFDRVYVSTTTTSSGAVAGPWEQETTFYGTSFVNGQSYSVTLNGLSFDFSARAGGTYYIVAVLDDDSILSAVSDRSRTVGSFAFTVPSIPDLDITSTDISSSVEVGDNLEFTYGATNVGMDPTDGSVWYDDVYIYLATDQEPLRASNFATYISPADIGVANPLPAGSGYEYTHIIPMANREPGSYYLTLILNHVLYEEVAMNETTDENNRVDLPFTVVAPTPSASPSPAPPSPSSSPAVPSPSSSPAVPSPSSSPAGSTSPMSPSPSHSPLPSSSPDGGSSGRTVINFNFRDLIPADYRY